MTTLARRCFIEVEGRRVHYRRLGEGPPVVMLHGSPGDSSLVSNEMAACAGHSTVFALDTPGFGYSEALPGETLTVRDLAQATAAAMATLGLPPCPVYGTHTGAAIGIELGVGWPDRVSGLVLEGLPAFTDAEIAEVFKDYFAPMVPDPLGGHLLSTWVRFRDQFTWFPWPSRDVRRLNPLDRPQPADIDLWVSMFYRACKTYRPAYRAACTYGQAALRAAEALTLPAIYMASADDMLFPHLDRLPPMKTGQRVERLPHDAAAKYSAIAGFLRDLPGSSGRAPAHRQLAAGADPRHLFIDGPQGQIFVRLYGDAGQPGVLLLHDAPGTGLAMAATARALAGGLHVILPDHPGCGLTPAPASGTVLDAAAGNALAIADALGLEDFIIAAKGCGCAVAAHLLDRAGPRITACLLEDPEPVNQAQAEAFAPELPLSPEGAHWVKAWLMLRDAQIYHPWCAGTIAAQRSTQGNFDADWLHDQTTALMEGRASYHLLPREAARYLAEASLAATGSAVRLVPEAGLAQGVLAALGLAEGENE